MANPNGFLLITAVGGNIIHGPTCFCTDCRQNRLRDVLNSGLTIQELYNRCFIELVEKEDNRLNRLFSTTLNRIVTGKAYMDQCLAGSGYRMFGWWAKQAPQFRHLSAEERKSFVAKVNEINQVYNKWDTIANNLTDNRIVYLDARKLSVNQLYRAKEMSWCLQQNELNKPVGRRNEGEPGYPEDMYQIMLQAAWNTGLFDHVGHDTQVVAAIGARFQRDVICRSRARFNPY